MILIQTVKNRLPYIDCAKGITILLVIFAHTIGNGGRFEAVLRGIIFSFHMPLFFILSCMTSRFSTDGNELIAKMEKTFIRLLIPAILIGSIRPLYEIAIEKDFRTILMLGGGLVNRLVYASGVLTNIQNTEVEPLGMCWFLVALFCSKLLFDYLQLKCTSERKLSILVLICSLVGVLISFLQWLPLNFDIVLAIQPFLYAGFKLKKFDITNHTVRNLLFVTVAFLLLLAIEFFVCNNYLELAARRYALWPLSFVIAFCGTLAVLYVSQILQYAKIFNWLNYLGKNSFIIFTFHALDYIWKPIWQVTENNYLNCLFRMILDIGFTLILCLILHFRNKMQEK